MGQAQITVANQTICLCYDGSSGQGRVVRLDDGLEADFSSPECLPHLLEGLVGRRTWQAHRERIEAELAQILPCA
jgi:hypothetical protein